MVVSLIGGGNQRARRKPPERNKGQQRSEKSRAKTLFILCLNFFR
jgi:hypothetical protein